MAAFLMKMAVPWMGSRRPPRALPAGQPGGGAAGLPGSVSFLLIFRPEASTVSPSSKNHSCQPLFLISVDLLYDRDRNKTIIIM